MAAQIDFPTSARRHCEQPSSERLTTAARESGEPVTGQLVMLALKAAQVRLGAPMPELSIERDDRRRQ